MTYDYIMVRFGELSTKGKNKKEFIRVLAKNIKNALSDFPSLEHITRFDHIYIKLNDVNYEDILPILTDVSGIHSLSIVKKLPFDIEEIKKTALEMALFENKKTFKVHAKRANKSFPIISDDINRIVATLILKNSEYKVDVHNPDIIVNIEVRDDAVYMFSHTIKAAGGYPLGVGGKVMHMLSGGIDSPVAAYLLMKRGLKIECIHFASPPYTNIGVIEKLKDLLKELNRYQMSIKLTIIPFTKLQEKIYEVSDESYAITLMRRMMYRLAYKLAIKNNCMAISNGESVGQVASQTLESINVINEVTNYPVLRPLLTYDKVDIIDISRRIKTYDISIRPYEDCCTIFAPKNPKTKPSLKRCIEFESRFDYESMIEEALNNVEVIHVRKDEDEF